MVRSVLDLGVLGVYGELKPGKGYSYMGSVWSKKRGLKT